MPTPPTAPRIAGIPLPVARSQRVPLIVFSHLRWGFVFQRPQHLLTRLAKDFDVVFVEEPVHTDAEPHLACVVQAHGVEVVTPHTRVQASGFHDDQLATLKALLADFTAERGIVQPLVWLYTPMALPLVADLDPLAVVYDCMDDLASFKFAPRQLVQREAALMKMADLVLTGGPSLYEARKDRHPNIHCLPSAVDAQHFSAARLAADSPEALAARALHEGLPRPRLGFFGVIDERLDLELVAGIADRRPDWQVVMVGPVVKIDPAALPQRPNIRWLGMQGYERLPYLQSQWDVCLLPFALNEATRFISPTKTLEYLAGGKPVVSTPIHDVVSLYGTAVRIAADADGFVAAVQEAFDEAPRSRAERAVRAQALVDGCTWNGTAGLVGELLTQLVGRATAPGAAAARPREAAPAQALVAAGGGAAAVAAGGLTRAAAP
jgi:glycosyltransferase involved in cell wall biosynthesis